MTSLLENISGSFSFHSQALFKSLCGSWSTTEGGIHHAYYAFYKTTMRSNALSSLGKGFWF